ncbi:hypothetical protein Mic7113_0206 [Allocoleopsis franciscana PCC 7113]|uniref:Uncharacterized protein n=2 Tax=Allocoleopsis TaxID=2886347 RepID=K9W6Z9_9CYAN|nr:hypothetical protein Mic7113_0206 [Allocoleopsis franciscana PCC 7113]
MEALSKKRLSDLGAIPYDKSGDPIDWFWRIARLYYQGMATITFRVKHNIDNAVPD